LLSTLKKGLKIILKQKSSAVGLILMLFLFALILVVPFFFHLDPYKIDYDEILEPPSFKHIFGTDHLGRDIFARVLCGGSLSLIAGFISASTAMVLGVLLGIIAGVAGGVIDELVRSIANVLLSFPSIILALAIVAVLGPNLSNVLLGVSISVSPIFIRVIRGAVLTIMSSEYVLGAKALGSSRSHLIIKYIIPNTAPTIIVLWTLYIPSALISASALNFLGLGVQPPTPEWGALLNDAKNYLSTAWWTAFFPGLFICITVLSFNLLGDGLKRILDPRLKI
jgi:peptide/nickel transport system permease protein